jgi:NAD+ synthase
LGDLTKTEVYRLAKVLNIPQRIIEKTPSAGLWPGQTDEEEMGIKYKLLDEIIYSIEGDRSLEKFDKKIIEKVLKKKKQSSHKLNPPKMFKINE